MEATILAQKDLGTLIESQGKKPYFSFQGDINTFNSCIKKELGVQDGNNIALREPKPPTSKQNINTDINKVSLSKEGLAEKEEALSDKEKADRQDKKQVSESAKPEKGEKTNKSSSSDKVDIVSDKGESEKLSLDLKLKEEEKETKVLYVESVYNTLKQVIDKIADKSANKVSGKLSKSMKEARELLANLKQMMEEGKLKAENINIKELEDLYKFLNKDGIKGGRTNLTGSSGYEAILIKVNKLLESQIGNDKAKMDGIKGKKVSPSKWSIRKSVSLEGKSSYNDGSNVNKGSSSVEVVDSRVESQEVFIEKSSSYSFGDTRDQMESSFTVQSNKIKLPNGMSKAQGQDLFNQVIKKAFANIGSNRSEVRIQLEPRVFGNITLNILMDNGVVSGSFNVDNRLVKQTLEENLVLLKESLEEQGLVMDNIDISYRDEDAVPSNDDRDSFVHYSSSELELEEAEVMDRYMMPEWMAREVNMVI